jgi:hypothetical protein
MYKVKLLELRHSRRRSTLSFNVSRRKHHLSLLTWFLSRTRNKEEDYGLALTVDIFFLHAISLLSNLIIIILHLLQVTPSIPTCNVCMKIDI